MYISSSFIKTHIIRYYEDETPNRSRKLYICECFFVFLFFLPFSFISFSQNFISFPFHFVKRKSSCFGFAIILDERECASVTVCCVADPTSKSLPFLCLKYSYRLQQTLLGCHCELTDDDGMSHVSHDAFDKGLPESSSFCQFEVKE